MSHLIDPDDHPLQPEDEDSELRYDHRTEPDEGLGEDDEPRTAPDE